MITDQELDKLNTEFEKSDPGTILNRAIDQYGKDVAMSTGFGVSGIVLMHQISLIDPKIPVFYLDTDLLFGETYDLIEKLESRLGISLIRVRTEVSLEEQARLHGDKLWESQPDKCCYIRKVLPLKSFLDDKKAWITGIRRDQSISRKNTPIFQWENDLQVLKISPLATWTEEEVWTYVRINELPYNELHDKGYPSIGCWPCTQAVAEGDDLRAGRWSGNSKTECGIHK